MEVPKNDNHLVRFNSEYDNFGCAEPWAHRTLAKHAKDHRPVLYTEKQLENAETHDQLWNAAQMQMVNTGWMRNYMRMYWAKKILEWSRTPAEAHQIAVRLNDKYELDGRDPNGYAGIAWAIAANLIAHGSNAPSSDRFVTCQARARERNSTARNIQQNLSPGLLFGRRQTHNGE